MLQQDFKWPHGVLAGRPLKELDIPCSPCSASIVGSAYHTMVGDPNVGNVREAGMTLHFVDFSKPMNQDGWVSEFEFDAKAHAGATITVHMLMLAK